MVASFSSVDSRFSHPGSQDFKKLEGVNPTSAPPTAKKKKKKQQPVSHLGHGDTNHRLPRVDAKHGNDDPDEHSGDDDGSHDCDEMMTPQLCTCTFEFRNAKP